MSSIIGKGYKIGKDGKLKKTGPRGYAAVQARGRSKRGRHKAVAPGKAKLLAELK